MIKRFLDITISLCFLIPASPVLFIIGLMIKLDSSGPAFFKQKRVGLKGKEFNLYKYRTMVDRAEELGPRITAQNDPRVTRFGKILRLMKIDEIPQLINVLKGDMSLVGPRPEIPGIVAKYTSEQRQVLDARPGLTSPAQILNRYEEERLSSEEDVEKAYEDKILPEKLRMDLEYVQNSDRSKDLKIFMRGWMALWHGTLKLGYIFEGKRRLNFLILDLAIAGLTYWFAFLLRFEGELSEDAVSILLKALPLVIVLRGVCFVHFSHITRTDN